MTPLPQWRFEGVEVARQLSEAGDQIDELLAVHGASERSRFAARLIAEEVVLNALEHGRARRVTLDISSGQPRELLFEDDGSPFDPAERPAIAPAATTADVRSRGRGLVLILGFAKTVRHERSNGSNRLHVELVE